LTKGELSGKDALLCPLNFYLFDGLYACFTAGGTWCAESPGRFVEKGCFVELAG
jgi:hypothetical protein